MIANLFGEPEETPSEEYSPNTSQARKERRKRSKEEKAEADARLKSEIDKRNRIKWYVIDCLNDYPPGYISTQVKYIGNNSFRVNIHAYTTPTGSYKFHDKIVHSFIVYETPDGQLYANPPIPSTYHISEDSSIVN